MKSGDFCQLRSGGPVMSVMGVNVMGVQCCWFDGSEYHQALLPMPVLRQCDSEGKPIPPAQPVA